MRVDVFPDDVAIRVDLDHPVAFSLGREGVLDVALADDAEVMAVFVGDVASGPLLTFRVTDVDAVGAYEATLLEVADRTNELRASLADYAVEVSGSP